MIVEHVDFISVPVTDMERSKQFYGETLGLPQTGDGGFPEYRLGDNGFLYLLSLEAIGGSFQGPHTAGFALRVPDVAEAKGGARGQGRRVLRRARQRRLQHGVPRGSRRQPDRPAPPLRAA